MHNTLFPLAKISNIMPGSPAEKAGLHIGDCITLVNNAPLTDYIVWMWETSDYTCTLEVIPAGASSNAGSYDVKNPSNVATSNNSAGSDNIATSNNVVLSGDTHKTLELYRSLNEDWGIEFDDVIFDSVKTCCNNCIFCFMKMLPKGTPKGMSKGMRSSLYLRDDDYRLSFLQGNFVTLTNLTDSDVERITEMRLEPINVSLHAISHDIRRQLMGDNEARGFEVLKKLIESDIEIHAQIVLCPGVNDSDELKRTLNFVRDNPCITSLAIVPVGYTRYSSITSSYSDNPKAAQEIVDLVATYQEQSRKENGTTRFYLADEFYNIVGIDKLPSANEYDGFPQFDDGIGALRSFLDETSSVCSKRHRDIDEIKGYFEYMNQWCVERRLCIVCGEGASTVYERFIAELAFQDFTSVIAVKNNFFGGNVNVGGLLTAQDILEQVPQNLDRCDIIIPSIIFNDDNLTLDDISADDLSSKLAARGAIVHITPALPNNIIDALMQYAYMYL